MTQFAKMPLEDSPWIDRHDLEDVENYITYCRGLGAKAADLLGQEDSRAAESFLIGAQQALVRYNITTRAHKKTKRSSFRFADLKEGDAPTTVILIADASRSEAQKPLLGLLQWCMLQELKRHDNKHRPVYVIANEATNFYIQGLASLLTWGREYGIRLHIIIQSLSAFRRVYGQDTLNTLISETEIKQFLPGQRETETLDLIEKLLANQSVIARGRRAGNHETSGRIEGEDLREDARPLMTADEIRRTDKTILILRRNKPLLLDLPPIAAIAPFRKMIGINPFHGKPFLRPVKLRINRDPLWMRVRETWNRWSSVGRPER